MTKDKCFMKNALRMILLALTPIWMVSCGAKHSGNADSIAVGVEETVKAVERPGVDLGLSVN
ncbi:MAG: hypothetical protein HDR88_07710 [Bacteroides sp.]|nr:hypothetical protein [Bacteroides sp.]